MISLNTLLDPLERLITEHGSAAILREHLGFIKAQLAEQERQRGNLQAEHTDMKAALDQAQGRIRGLEAELQQLREAQRTGLCCDHCGSINIQRSGSRPNKVFGRLGSKDALYRCSDCGGETAQLID